MKISMFKYFLIFARIPEIFCVMFTVWYENEFINVPNDNKVMMMKFKTFSPVRRLDKINLLIFNLDITDEIVLKFH